MPEGPETPSRSRQGPGGVFICQVRNPLPLQTPGEKAHRRPRPRLDADAGTAAAPAAQLSIKLGLNSVSAIRSMNEGAVA